MAEPEPPDTSPTGLRKLAQGLDLILNGPAPLGYWQRARMRRAADALRQVADGGVMQQ